MQEKEELMRSLAWAAVQVTEVKEALAREEEVFARVKMEAEQSERWEEFAKSLPDSIFTLDGGKWAVSFFYNKATLSYTVKEGLNVVEL